MANEESSIFTKAHHPAIQAIGIFVAGVFVTCCSKIIQSIGLLEVGERFPWMTAASFLLFFAIFNSISSVAAKDANKYWTRSMFSFGGLAVASGLAAWGFSQLSIEEAGSYKWIFVVLTFGYLIFLSMMGFLKRIVNFAEKEDWQHPRKR